MATLADYANHPERITEDEWKEYFEAMKSMEELGKSLEAYNIKINSDNTNSNISNRFYKEYFVMSAVLEPFLYKGEVDFKELNASISNYVPKNFLYEIPVTYFHSIILKMIRLGLIIPVKTENINMPIFKITEEGMTALQQHTFQSLATSSFYNYQTYELNKRSLRMNVLMLIVTIMSVIVTVITILK